MGPFFGVLRTNILCFLCFEIRGVCLCVCMCTEPSPQPWIRLLSSLSLSVSNYEEGGEKLTWIGAGEALCLRSSQLFSGGWGPLCRELTTDMLWQVQCPGVLRPDS